MFLQANGPLAPGAEPLSGSPWPGGRVDLEEPKTNRQHDNYIRIAGHSQGQKRTWVPSKTLILNYLGLLSGSLLALAGSSGFA
jgi:hypothetical protein